jgi:tetratricopeptide (TPR) repeat protein
VSVDFWPRRAVPFLNRNGPRQDICEHLAARRAEQRVGLVYVHAPEGLGRSSLIAEVFHENRDLFDDDYIEVAARQANDLPTPMGEMLGQALRGLGTADTDLPTSERARIEAFQRLSAGRRFLLVIKDAVKADQVRPLIPGAAPEAAVLVTTRRVLRELYMLDFVDIPLGKLPAPDSRELLTSALGPTADTLDATTVTELAELCDGYPLLIRLVAAQLKGRPRAARRFLAEVRGSAATLLEMELSLRLVTFLSTAYDSRPRKQQRTYRRVSLIPGPSFTATTAAIALDVDVDEAEKLLDELVDANLLLFEEDRFSFHSIIRADARRRARDDDGDKECSAVISKLATWFLQEAVPRDAALSDRWRVGPAFAKYVRAGQAPPTRDDAITWFEAEWQTVVACIDLAHSVGLHQVSAQLCIAVFKFLHQHGHTDAWLDSHGAGVKSAEACGDVEAIMQVTNQRGAAWLAVGDLAAARKDFEASLAAAIRARHVLGVESNHEWLGKLAAAEGDLESAFACYNRAEDVIDHAGAAIPAKQEPRMRGLLGLQRARAYLRCAAWLAAIDAVSGALQYFDEHSNERENRAKCLIVFAEAVRGAGDSARAVAAYREASTLFEADNLRRLQAGALHRLGEMLAEEDRVAACDALRSAWDLYSDLGDPAADVARSRLLEFEQ